MRSRWSSLGAIVVLLGASERGHSAQGVISNSHPALFAASNPTTKSDASDDGCSDAQRDVQTLAIKLKQFSAESLIQSFIRRPRVRRNGGYQYYYCWMANAAIRDELKSRGRSAEASLRKHQDDSTLIAEAVNGPGETVGKICKSMLGAATRPAAKS